MINKDTVAQAVITQQIALATGVTTITLTFYKNFSPTNVNNGLPSDEATNWLIATWITFGLSVLLGLLTLMVFVNSVPAADANGTPAANKPAVKALAILQSLLFFAGFVCMVVGVITAT